MLKDLLKTVSWIYSPIILLGFVGLFFIVQCPFLQKIPDYFLFQSIENTETYISTLLAILVGSSSIILTILLVVYSSFSQKLKRNSFDFILNNPWIKLIFSLFCGSVLFLSLSLFIIKSQNTDTVVTLLYISTFITVFILLVQFPLIVLSLKHSNSYEIIKKMINKITDDEIADIFDLTRENQKFSIIDKIEKNAIIQLKDIGVYAIKENDWGLPQTMLNDLYEKLIEPLNKDTSYNKLVQNVFAFNFICNHFKRVAVEESDHITLHVLLYVLEATHSHFATERIRSIRYNPIDSTINDMSRLIIDNNNFYDIQSRLLTVGRDLIKKHINSTHFTNDELPTTRYLVENKLEYNVDDEIRDYWHYLTFEISDIYFYSLEYAIEQKNKNVYSRVSWNLHGLFDIILESKALTDYQKEEIFNHYYYKASKVSNLAMDQGIYNSINVFSNHQIEKWLEVNTEIGLRAFWEYYSFIGKLYNRDQLTELYIDDFFMIGRSLTLKNVSIETKTKIQVIDNIFEKGFEIAYHDRINKDLKLIIVNQLNWLNSMTRDKEYLNEINAKYNSKIMAFSNN